MCIFLLAGGLSLLNPTENRAASIGPVVLFVYLFTICYSLGEGPVAFQYSAEVFPTIQREQGMAWAVCINNTFGEYSTNHIASPSILILTLLTHSYSRCPWLDIPPNGDSHDPDWSL